MTLYVSDNDKTAGTSSCTGPCRAAWPPLTVTGTPTYGAGLTASMFSTIAGDQLAVNGKPLYLWTADQKAGDATGQGIGGFYVVGVDGRRSTRAERKSQPVAERFRFEPLPRLEPPPPPRLPRGSRPVATRQPSGKNSETMRSSTTGFVVEVGPAGLEVRDFHRPPPRVAAIGCDVRMRPSRTSPTFT